MSVRKKKAIEIAFLVVGMTLTLLIGRWSRAMELGIGTLVILGAIIWEAFMYCCPHCGRYLGGNFRSGKYCPHCGEKIE